jgi:serine/threonine protein kinase
MTPESSAFPSKGSIPVSSQSAETVPPPSQVGEATLPPPLQDAAALAATALQPQTPPTRFGRYHLLKTLGQGGMGSVYLAHDTQLDRQVALKIPQFTDAQDPHSRERFLREARAAAALHHVNVCPIYDVGDIDGVPYLTMAYIPGQPLSALLPRNAGRDLAQREAASIVRRVALALEDAHRLGIIHRDLKPGNIMIDPKGEPVVMDFGLARRGNPADARLTLPGAVMGTPAYMSPEQARGDQAEMGPSCDIYSLGVVLYELLTGQLPFVGDTLSILSQLVMDEPKPPRTLCPGIDLALERICLKAMAKKREARFRSMADFASALADYLDSPAEKQLRVTRLSKTTVLEQPAPLAEQRKSRWLARGATVAGLILLGSMTYIAANRLGLTDRRPDASAPASGDLKPKAPDEPARTDHWPAQILKEGKIAAPDLIALRPRFHDDFSKPGSLPRNKDRCDYDKGRYVVYHGGFWEYTNPARHDLHDFACQVVGKLTRRNAGEWGIVICGKDRENGGILIAIGPDQSFRVGPTLSNAKVNRSKEIPLTKHPAINPLIDLNTILTILRGQTLELYINGKAVCDPIRLERDLGPARIQLGSAMAPSHDARIEYLEFNLWPRLDALASLETRLSQASR